MNEQPKSLTYARVKRDVRWGWIAQAGYEGWQPYEKMRFTRLGAFWAAKKMERRLRRESSE